MSYTTRRLAQLPADRRSYRYSTHRVTIMDMSYRLTSAMQDDLRSALQVELDCELITQAEFDARVAALDGQPDAPLSRTGSALAALEKDAQPTKDELRIALQVELECELITQAEFDARVAASPKPGTALEPGVTEPGMPLDGMSRNGWTAWLDTSRYSPIVCGPAICHLRASYGLSDSGKFYFSNNCTGEVSWNQPSSWGEVESPTEGILDPG